MMTAGLGRRKQHDPRSLMFPAHTAKIQTVNWNHAAPVLDQGATGACTGFSLTQLLNTTRFSGSRPKRRYLTDQTAYQIYSAGTHLDEFPGSWPPDDTGSSSIGVCKAAVNAGYLHSYRHAFGLNGLLAALQTQPLIVGTDWYQGMTYPGPHGICHPTGDHLGGHEYLCLGASLATQTLLFLNSWGPSWPTPRARGRFRITFADFDTLLRNDGDVTQPIGR